MNDILRTYQRCQHNHPDRLTEIMCSLHRQSERNFIAQVARFDVNRLPDGAIKERLLDLRSQARQILSN